MSRCAAVAILVGCHAAAPPSPAATREAPAFHEAWLDRSVDPCEDFYQYACGGWRAQTPIPADKPSWDTSFSPVYAGNEQVLREILEDAAGGKADPDDPSAGQLGAFYAACMDDAATDAALATLRAQLATIDAIASPSQLARAVAAMHMATLDENIPLFGFGPIQDAKDATQVIGAADQAGLTLPDRDYYVTESAANAATRAELRQYMADMFVLAGEDRARALPDADQVLAIETALARAQMPNVDRRNPDKTYHRLDRAGLATLAPSFDWGAYFAAIGTPDVAAINVMTPDFFARGVEPLVQPDRLAALRPYLRWHAIGRASSVLGPAFRARSFAFRRIFTGVQAPTPRWRECVSTISSVMPEAIGRAYVARKFGPAQKAGARDMIDRIEAAFASELDDVTWMDAPTKTRARAKLHAIANKIGYPDHWRDYGSLALSRTAPLDDLLRATTFESQFQLAHIGRPVARDEMNIAPFAADANYSAARNEMNFPAGIMQPPFFAVDAPPASNYGAIGMVVGHELIHGFDDSGRKHDGLGNVVDWWSAASNDQYNRRAACVSRQYSSYTVVDDLKLDGALTLGENIADNGGLALAYRAYRQLGADDDRGFFLAFAQLWCTNQRPELSKILLKIDQHSARQWRVNGSVSNAPAFQRAFQCRAGAKLAPVDRCVLW